MALISYKRQNPQTGNEWKRALDRSVAGGETSVTSSFLQKQKAHLLTNSPPRDFYAQKYQLGE